MTQEDFPDFIKILSTTFRVYDRKEPSEYVIAVWWEILKLYDLQSVREAFFGHMRKADNGMFMPLPADIIKLLEGTSSDKAFVAWTKFEKAVSLYGHWNSVVFDDPLIHRVVSDMGGWTIISTKGNKEWSFVKNEFLARYRSYAFKGIIPHYPHRLTGVFEMQNLINGYHVQAPCIMGDLKKAQLVQQGKVAETSQRTRQAILDEPMNLNKVCYNYISPEMTS